MSIFDLITLLGGLAFFLFGMNTMGSGLKGLAGGKMEHILWKLSSNPIKGLLLGTFVTAVIQSSSATTVMVVSFVNAGMMKLSQTITIILGAQIGTTATGWILTLASANGGSGLARLVSPSTFVPVMALIGAVFFMFSSSKTWKNAGSILLGLALLMTGMSTMSSAVAPLKSDPKFISILTAFDNPVLGFFAGLALAAVIQSCSAGVGILQALAITGVLTYNACVPLIMGINLGASSPVLLSMVGSTKNGRRAAMSYVISIVFAIVLIFVPYYILRLCGLFSFMDNTAESFGIAVFNTLSRTYSVILLTPVYRLIEKCSRLIIRYHSDEDADTAVLEQLTEAALRFPSTAIGLSNTAVHKMAELAGEAIAEASQLVFHYDKAAVEKIAALENLLDKYEDKLGDFMVRLLTVEHGGEYDREAEKTLSSISDLERLGDHAMNLAELAGELQEKKLSFSAAAVEELRALSNAVLEITYTSTNSFCSGSTEEALKVEPLEEVIDIVCDELKLRHVARLQKGECTLGVGFIFNDLITNYERISDHCSNLGIYTLKVENPRYMPHEYACSVEATATYTEHFLHYTEKYVSNL